VSSAAVYQTDLPGLLCRGKVRELYDLGDRLMIVASDRISAFDVVMKEPVPGKGVVLTQMSRFWMETLAAARPHHLEYVVSDDGCPPGYEPYRDQLRGRAMVVKKAAVLPIECVVRGYIIGGGWTEYRERGSVSGVELPTGLRLADRLPQPLFTPSTKAAAGHDEPISFEQASELAADFAHRCGEPRAAGRQWMMEARERSLAIYGEAAGYAESRRIILADTKFEFGRCEGQLLLVDEVLTPDSSRFWPKDQWRPGENPPSFDKQVLRDYLNTLSWNKTPPPPPLPPEVVERTRQRYLEAFRLLTGRSLMDA